MVVLLGQNKLNSYKPLWAHIQELQSSNAAMVCIYPYSLLCSKEAKSQMQPSTKCIFSPNNDKYCRKTETKKIYEN